MDAYEKQLDSIKLKYTYTYPLDEQGNIAPIASFSKKLSSVLNDLCAIFSSCVFPYFCGYCFFASGREALLCG